MWYIKGKGSHADDIVETSSVIKNVVGSELYVPVGGH